MSLGRVPATVHRRMLCVMRRATLYFDGGCPLRRIAGWVRGLVQAGTQGGKMRRVSGLSGASVLVLLAACGGDGGAGPGNGGGGGGSCPANTFCMTASTFNPTSRTVAANATVTWSNDSGVDHNVTFDTPSAALGVGGTGGNFAAGTPSTNQRRFATAGTYPFHCTIHGSPTSGMRGNVVVQ